MLFSNLQIPEGISCKQVQFLRKGLFLLFCFHCFRLLDGSRMAGRLASGLSDSTFLEVLERCHIIFIPLIIIMLLREAFIYVLAEFVR